MKYRLYIIILFLISPFIYGNTSISTDVDYTDKISKILIDENARLLSLLIPEIEEIINNKNISLENKINFVESYINNNEEKKKILKEKAKEAFEHAENFASIGKIKEASYYYSIACFFDKENNTYLKKYINKIIEWADRNIKSSKPELAIRILSDTERFLYSNISLINPNSIDDILSLILKIDKKIKDANTIITKTSSIKGINSLKQALEETSKILTAPIPDGLDNIINYQMKLQTLSGQLMKYYSQNQDEKTFIAIKNLSLRINEVQPKEEAERILVKGNKVLERVNKEKKYDYIHIEEAVLIKQRLHFLSFSASNDLRRRINTYNKKVDEIISKSTQLIGNKAIKILQNKYNAVKVTLIKHETNAEKALSSLHNIQNTIIAESSKITDIENLKAIKELLYNIEKEINEWKNIQQVRYEKWAINTIIKFNNVYKDELGLLGSGRETKERIFIGLVDYLCPIDLKYLTVPGIRAYTEIFDFYYEELDRDQRLDLSNKFINCDKKLLKEF